MQTATAAGQATINTLTGLTYLDTLISGATMQGLRYINVDGNFVSAAMTSTLQSAGYSVAIQYFFGDEENHNFPRCVIRW